MHEFERQAYSNLAKSMAASARLTKTMFEMLREQNRNKKGTPTMGSRTVTISYGGMHANGNTFTHRIEVDADDPIGDNPKFFGEQMENAVIEAGAKLRKGIEAIYGRPVETPVLGLGISVKSSP